MGLASTDLVSAIRVLVGLFPRKGGVRRIFIDEISAVPGWEKALKRLIDAGELARTLLVTTGSKATDLRRGVERLPGRKGRLARTSYVFTPVSYREFRRRCRDKLGNDTLIAYLLSGGSPVACAELARNGRIPEFVTAMLADWILGEMAMSGRSRSALLGVLQTVYRYGGTPLGYAKVAREAGLANNTVAQGYLDVLADLLCVLPCFAWDPGSRVHVRGKPCKFHFTNSLVAVAWHPARPQSPAEFKALSPSQGGQFLEWVVAQEIWRRAAIREAQLPDALAFWHSKEHEIDFVTAPDTYVEVKRGAESPLDYRWFLESQLKGTLLVINQERFESPRIRGVTLEDFLLEEE